MNEGFGDEVKSRGCRLVIVDGHEVLGVYDAQRIDGAAGCGGKHPN